MLSGFLGEKHELDASDVQTIANEMRAEIGSDLHVPPAAVDIEALAASARVTPAYELSIRRLEERMERVERTVGATIDLLHSILHPEKNRPGGPNAAER
jgi:hypothetical protein